MELLSAPCAPAYQLYTGVLWQAAEVDKFPSWYEDVIVFSGLFGMIRVSDEICDHRLSMDVKLPGIGGLASYWKKQLPPASTPVLDLRSSSYAAALKAPKGSLAVSVIAASGKVVSHWAKQWRGLLARELMSQDVRSLADVPDCAHAMAGVASVEVEHQLGKLVLHLAN